MQNPYSKAQVVLANGAPITDLRMPGSNQRMLSESSGEFNAHDKAELIRMLGGLMSSVSSGQVVRADSGMTHQQRQELREARRELLAESSADSKKWNSLGADMALRITEQREREGIMRRVSVGQNLKQGELPRVLVPLWDQTSVVATGPANVQFQFHRNKQFFPSEFEIVHHVRAERIEIEQVGSDVLDDMYNQGLDATMVAEDRLWKRAVDMTPGTVNPLNYITGKLTPQLLGELRAAVSDWNLPVTTAVMSNDFWPDITGSAEFATFLDPVTKYDLALNGQLGTLVGLTLITDGFRQPNQKVLNRGEIYVLSSPEHHACYSDRGGVRSEPSSGTDTGSTARGWLMSEILSFTLANARSVAKGQRV